MSDDDMAKVRRRKSPPKTSNLMMIRLVVLGGLGLVGLAVFLLLGFLNEKDNNQDGWRNPTVSTASAPVADNAVPPPGEDEAVRLVKSVLSMRRAAQFGGKVRLKGMTEAEAEDFLAHLEEKEGKVARVEWASSILANNLQIEGAVVYFSGNTVRSRLAFLTPNENGVWQFDMAAFARKCSIDWGQLVSGPPCEARIRAVCGRDSYFNGDYADEKVWNCYRLVYPDQDDSVPVGYCRKGSPADQALGHLLAGGMPVRVILQLKKATPPGNRQCEIVSVIAQDWVESDIPFDDRYR